MPEDRYAQLHTAMVNAERDSRPMRYSGSEYDSQHNSWEYHDIPQEGDSASYGDFEPLPGKTPWKDGREALLETPLFLYLPVASGSDYSGEAVTVANYNVFKDTFSGEPWIWEVYGGYGTYALAVHIQAVILSERFEELLEMLTGLGDYPVLSDDELSEVEMKSQEESWDGCAKHDFVAILGKLFDCELTIPDDALYQLFSDAADRSNTYWENETGNNAYIDLERVAAVVTLDEIEAYIDPA